VLAKSEIGEYGRLWESDGTLGSDEDAATARGVVDAILGRSVHGKWYRESCMVLKTSKAMAQATRLAVAQQVRVRVFPCVCTLQLRACPFFLPGVCATCVLQTWREAVERVGSRSPRDVDAAHEATQRLRVFHIVFHSVFGRASSSPPTVTRTSTAGGGSGRPMSRLSEADASQEVIAALTALVLSLEDAGACQLAARAMLFSPAITAWGDVGFKRLEAVWRQLLIKVRLRTAMPAVCVTLSMHVLFCCVLSSLLMQILSSKDVDVTAACACMLALLERPAFETFSHCIGGLGQDFARMEQVACVGQLVAGRWGKQEKFMRECERMRINAIWCQRLNALGIRADVKRFVPDEMEYLKCVARPVWLLHPRVTMVSRSF
jgi:hypothetical protein